MLLSATAAPRGAPASAARGPAATLLRRTQFTGARLVSPSTSFKARSPQIRGPRAEIKWTLDVDDEWLANDGAKWKDQVFPIPVTDKIDAIRSGPNNTAKITLGAVSDLVDVALVVSTISGVHAELEEDGDTGDLFITDLGSTNGTYVSGERIAKNSKTKLKPGDRVSLGEAPVFKVLRNAVAHA